jgi:hypothetical protein
MNHCKFVDLKQNKNTIKYVLISTTIKVKTADNQHKYNNKS